MSHKATNWAIQQRGLRPVAKIVLWHLCDRYHPDHGCFPAQATLAHDCEISRSGLNNVLRDLEEAGLIRREQRIDDRTQRQKSTRYILAFEDGFEAVESSSDNCGTKEERNAEPCPEIGHGAVSRNRTRAVSKKQPEPCPKNPDSRVQNLDTNSVKEPVIEPVSGEGAAAITRQAAPSPRCEGENEDARNGERPEETSGGICAEEHENNLAQFLDPSRNRKREYRPGVWP